MSDRSSEQERLRRLRDRQLAARNPQKAQRKLHRRIAQKQQRAKQTFSLGRMWSEIPHKWRNGFYGLVLGTLGLAVVPALWDSPFAPLCAGGSIPILAFIGFMIGRALDSRDEIKDLIR